MSWRDKIAAMRAHVEEESACNPASSSAHRQCPECGCDVYLITGKRSGISWFQHPDNNCIYDDWNRRLHFKSRDEAMASEHIFKEVKSAKPEEPKYAI